jgi:hypothetical protein
MTMMHTLNTRVVGRELQQFWIDLSAKPAHDGEWRTLGFFNEDGVLAAQPQAEPSSATVPSDEQIDAINSRYYGNYEPEMRPTYREVARAVLALAAPAVQAEPEPTRDPNELEADFEWRLNAWHKSRRPAAQSAAPAVQPRPLGYGGPRSLMSDAPAVQEPKE